jgi:hypothetical protein
MIFDKYEILILNGHDSATEDKHSHQLDLPTTAQPLLLIPHHTPSYLVMRESNFAFPGQNRASVCISSQLYDRRGLFYFLYIFIPLTSINQP